ncbi:MAG: ImmA/IrrE family metallo-endopeptidase [bacterium]
MTTTEPRPDPAPVEDLEQRAAEVLAGVPDYVWDGKQPPVPIEEIADSCFGLLVREVENMSAAPGAPQVGPGQSISGLLLASRGEIWVNAAEAREWPPRKRFTIAHELGHWILHRTGQQALFCRHGSVEESDRPELPPAEVEANAFAAALLMPADLVRAHHRACSGDLEQLCLIFDSSERAMKRRLASVN